MIRDIILLAIVSLATTAVLIGCTLLLSGGNAGTAAALAAGGFLVGGVALRTPCERLD